MKEKFQELATKIKIWIGDYPVRFVSLICIVVMVIGFALPFASLRGSIVIEGVSEYPIEVVSSRSKLISFNLMDFVLQKPVESIRVLERPISDLKVLDGTIMDILRTDGIDTEFFDELAKNLDESTISILVDPELQRGIEENLEIGADINAILTNVHGILTNAHQAVESISATIQEGNSVIQDISRVIGQIDAAKTAANILILLVFAAIIAYFVLLLRKKTSEKTLLIFSSVFLGLFMVIGIGLLAGNAVVAEKISEVNQNVNIAIFDSVTTVLKNMLGETGGLLGDFLRGQGDIVSLSLAVRADSGYWFIFVGAAISFILTLIQYIGLTPKDKETTATATEGTDETLQMPAAVTETEVESATEEIEKKTALDEESDKQDNQEA